MTPSDAVDPAAVALSTGIGVASARVETGKGVDAATAEQSLGPAVTGFASALPPQIEAGDREAKQAAAYAECNGDTYPGQEDPRECVRHCQQHQRPHEEPLPPGDRSSPSWLDGKAEEP